MISLSYVVDSPCKPQQYYYSYEELKYDPLLHSLLDSHVVSTEMILRSRLEVVVNDDWGMEISRIEDEDSIS